MTVRRLPVGLLRLREQPRHPPNHTRLRNASWSPALPCRSPRSGLGAACLFFRFRPSCLAVVVRAAPRASPSDCAAVKPSLIGSRTIMIVLYKNLVKSFLFMFLTIVFGALNEKIQEWEALEPAFFYRLWRS